jgi:hypothetical protein
MIKLFPAALSLILAPGLLHGGETRSWTMSTFSRLRRVPAEKDAPANSQPLHVDEAVLARALGSVRLVTERKEEPLFDPDEAGDVAKAMAEALSLAGPEEDLVLQSTAKRGRFVIGDSLAVLARVFAGDGGLNLIVQEARRDFMVEYRQETRMPEFDYGSRTVPGSVVLKAPGAQVRRADWLVLPLVENPRIPAAKALPQPAGGPSSVGAFNAPPAEQAPLPAGAPAGTSTNGSPTPSVVFSPTGAYTVQPADRYVVLGATDCRVILPDPGGANANRALIFLVPELCGRLILQCPSGPRLRHALDAFASSGSTCTIAASGTAPRIPSEIICVSDGAAWYCR